MKLIYYSIFPNERWVVVFFPSRKDGRFFQWASKLLPVAAWTLGLLIFCPTLIKRNGQFGLECKSMTCRWISIDHDLMPTEYDPEISGQVLVMIIGTLIVFLNLGTYIKVSVSFGLLLITILTYVIE